MDVLEGESNILRRIGWAGSARLADKCHLRTLKGSEEQGLTEAVSFAFISCDDCEMLNVEQVSTRTTLLGKFIILSRRMLAPPREWG